MAILFEVQPALPGRIRRYQITSAKRCMASLSHGSTMQTTSAANKHDMTTTTACATHGGGAATHMNQTLQTHPQKSQFLAGGHFVFGDQKYTRVGKHYCCFTSQIKISPVIRLLMQATTNRPKFDHTTKLRSAPYQVF